jgi:DNA-binding SARP family transcriptional activator
VRQHLTVEVIGPFAVRRCGIVLRGIEVGSRKARMLLALLAVERGRLVPIDRVVDALWGDAPPRRPAPDTATLVSRLRATLGPDTVTGGSSGYCLGVQVRVDLPDADRLVESAEAEPDGDHALVSARRALDLLEKGDVLADWPDAPRPARRGRGGAAPWRSTDCPGCGRDGAFRRRVRRGGLPDVDACARRRR